jgi:hypothetical protein
MKHFHKLADGFDVAPALEEIERLGVPEALGDLGPNPEGLRILTNHEIWRVARPALHALLVRAAAKLGGAPVWKAKLRIIPPHSRIKPHRDNLSPYEIRHHLALQCDDGAVFTVARERCRFRPGELWRVDLANHLHSVDNASDLERIVLMIDTFQS